MNSIVQGFPQFNELPVELQAYIISQYPETIQQTPLISHTIRELMTPSYIREISQLPISTTEMMKYLTTYPTRFIIFKRNQYISLGQDQEYISYDDMESFYYLAKLSTQCENKPFSCRWERSKIYNITRGNCSLINVENVIQFSVTPIVEMITDCTSNLNNPYIIKEGDLLDLLSMYIIYQNRLYCMRLNPEYAKQAILRYLDNLINGEYLRWTRFLILTEMQLYLYLLNNCDMLGLQAIETDEYIIRLIANRDNEGKLILDSIQIDPNAENIELIQNIQQSNKRLSDLIRKKLETL